MFQGMCLVATGIFLLLVMLCLAFIGEGARQRGRVGIFVVLALFSCILMCVSLYVSGL